MARRSASGGSAFMSADGGADLRALHARDGGRRRGVAEGPGWARQLEFERDGRHVTWELHNEFATLTWTAPADDWDAMAGGHRARVPRGAAAGVCDPHRRDADRGDRARRRSKASTRSASAIRRSSTAAPRRRPTSTSTRTASPASRWRPAAAASSGIGVIVRRLLEIETYRTMALIGLPLAREMGGRVDRVRAQLAAHHAERREGDTVEAPPGLAGGAAQAVEPRSAGRSRRRASASPRRRPMARCWPSGWRGCARGRSANSPPSSASSTTGRSRRSPPAGRWKSGSRR